MTVPSPFTQITSICLHADEPLQVHSVHNTDTGAVHVDFDNSITLIAKTPDVLAEFAGQLAQAAQHARKETTQ